MDPLEERSRTKETRIYFQLLQSGRANKEEHQSKLHKVSVRPLLKDIRAGHKLKNHLLRHQTPPRIRQALPSGRRSIKDPLQQEVPTQHDHQEIDDQQNPSQEDRRIG